MTRAAASDSLEIALPDAAATAALGMRIGRVLHAGDVVFLEGALSAGKTTLARGAVAAWTGSDEEVPSPTYTLVQIYEGARGALWHADLYRLKAPEEAEEIGLLDAMGRAACVIEWPDRLGALAPRDRLDVRLQFENGARRAALTGLGSWRERVDDL